jgi:hypothetical protein
VPLCHLTDLVLAHGLCRALLQQTAEQQSTTPALQGSNLGSKGGVPLRFMHASPPNLILTPCRAGGCRPA